jgi:hypothetical protein
MTASPRSPSSSSSAAEPSRRTARSLALGGASGGATRPGSSPRYVTRAGGAAAPAAPSGEQGRPVGLHRWRSCRREPWPFAAAERGAAVAPPRQPLSEAWLAALAARATAGDGAAAAALYELLIRPSARLARARHLVAQPRAQPSANEARAEKRREVRLPSERSARQRFRGPVTRSRDRCRASSCSR